MITYAVKVTVELIEYDENAGSEVIKSTSYYTGEFDEHSAAVTGFHRSENSIKETI